MRWSYLLSQSIDGESVTVELEALERNLVLALLASLTSGAFEDITDSETRDEFDAVRDNLFGKLAVTDE